jgi:hypothetical protein
MHVTLQVRPSSDAHKGRNEDELAPSQDVNKLSDRRVKRIRPLIPPQILQEDLPL